VLEAFMIQGRQFRRILPIAQTAVAMFFGGWGLCARNSILSRPFWGNSTGWDSTARFHVWPWPFKFAAVLNKPAFLTGALLSWLFDALRPGLPESISYLPVLFYRNNSLQGCSKTRITSRLAAEANLSPMARSICSPAIAPSARSNACYSTVGYCGPLAT